MKNQKLQQHYLAKKNKKKTILVYTTRTRLLNLELPQSCFGIKRNNGQHANQARSFQSINNNCFQFKVLASINERANLSLFTFGFTTLKINSKCEFSFVNIKSNYNTIRLVP